MTPLGIVWPYGVDVSASAAYQTTVGVTNFGLLARPVWKVRPLPSGAMKTPGAAELPVKRVPATHCPLDELVGPYQNSDRSTVAPPVGVHCISLPSWVLDDARVAQRKRSVAIHVPPDDVAAFTKFCWMSARRR